MARRTAGIGNRTFVYTQQLISLGDAAGDVALDMVCPGDEAKLLGGSATIVTVGIGDENHNLVIEHGSVGAGVALTPVFDVHAGVTLAAVGTIVVFAALDPAGQPVTVEGTNLQILNAEEGAISTGAIINLQLKWEL